METAEEAKFYETLGRTLAHWQTVEFSLFQAFRELIDCESEKVLSAVFHTPRNFSTRLDLVDAAAHVMLDVGLLAEWKELRQKIDREAAQRNKIAHLPVITFFPSPKPGPARTVLTAGYWNSATKQKRAGVPAIEYTREDVRNMGSAFRMLEQEMRPFIVKLVNAGRARRGEPPRPKR